MKLKIFAYVNGIDEAVVFYQNAFGAKIRTNGTWKNDDGTYQICEFELDGGSSFSLAKREGEYAIEGEINTGNIMQMTMIYKKEDTSKLEKAYEILKDGATILMPLKSVDFTSHTCDIIDKYGLRWCLMVW